jgi:hypothetical protein
LPHAKGIRMTWGRKGVLTRPGFPWGLAIGGSFPALPLPACRAAGAAPGDFPRPSPAGRRSLPRSLPDVRRRRPYPCRGNLGVLGGFVGCNPTGGGGSELVSARNPSGFPPMHFFCNKPCYCAVLGKLIGAGSPQGALDRVRFPPSLDSPPHPPQSPCSGDGVQRP